MCTQCSSLLQLAASDVTWSSVLTNDAWKPLIKRLMQVATKQSHTATVAGLDGQLGMQQNIL